jgi:hypothetical protein
MLASRVALAPGGHRGGNGRFNRAHASGPEHGGGWFDYRNGRIVVKYPDEKMLAKMRVIAEALGARVMGDEGELY